MVDLGEEGGVAAVVRPVGIDHTHLCNGGVAVFLVAEIGLQEGQVVQIHGKPHGLLHFGQCIGVHTDKAGDHSDFGGNLVVGVQGGRLVHGSLTGFYGVNEIALNLRKLLCGQCALQDVDLGGSNGRTFALYQQLDTLRTGVSTLVKLSGQRFHGKYGMHAGRCRKGLIIADVCHRLREYNTLCLRVYSFVHALDIVAAQIAHAGQGMDLQKIMQAVKQAARLHIKTGALLGITTINCHFGLLQIENEIVSWFCSKNRRKIGQTIKKID